MELVGEGLELHIGLISAPDREGWIRAAIRFRAPGVAGDFPAYVEPDDFERFAAGIAAMSASLEPGAVALLQTTEGQVLAEFTMLTLGHIAGRYRFVTAFGDPPVEVTGGFTLDQSSLPLIERGARGFLAELG